VKTIIIAVSAAAFIAAAPVAMMQGVSATTSVQQHKISARHHSAPATHLVARGTQAARVRATYPNAFSYVPSHRLDPEIEAARLGGGGSM
jgi:hypothetical protein